MRQPTYDQLLVLARRACRFRGDAEDLLQEALIEALRAGRDPARPEDQRWLVGVVRNKARMAARTAVRRRGREASWPDPRAEGTPREPIALRELLVGLPPSLGAVAALALTGHDRRELAYLLGVSDVALRKRISDLRRALGQRGLTPPTELDGLGLSVPYGPIRAALGGAIGRHGGAFGSHDPDGHLFLVRRSRIATPRQQAGVPIEGVHP